MLKKLRSLFLKTWIRIPVGTSTLESNRVLKDATLWSNAMTAHPSELDYQLNKFAPLLMWSWSLDETNGTNHKEGEDLLRERRLLREANLFLIADTMFFLCRIHFVPWSGAEHRSLQLCGGVHLIHTKHYSKKNQEICSITRCNRRASPATNEKNPNRCLVHLYLIYLNHHPADSQCF